MIISASRRTDIPAFYSDWFINRIKEGYVLVRNPINIHQISKISLNRDVVDFIVFWTKDPTNMLDKLDYLKEHNYYFQFTINPYDQNIEVNVNRKAVIIETFKTLSEKIGKNKVIWRYDPILVTDKINLNYHYEYFEKLASRLSNHTNKCIFSFIDFYTKTKKEYKGTRFNRNRYRAEKENCY